MDTYDPNEIEKKWQKIWDESEIYKAIDLDKKPKLFLLVEFPYPSGAGLHVGHCRSYTAMDIIARKRRMQGYNVLFPMGWDAFGLPSENYAIKTGIHPSITTKESIETFKKQEKSLGLSIDWSREVNTTDPAYYKWTQWIFLKLFKNGLAYKAKISVNWCLSCKIGLANEEVVDGKCERCGGEVEKREKEQWLIRITKYAQRLIQDLDLVNFPERVKALQKDWIGKSEGYEIDFKLKTQSDAKWSDRSELHQVKVFTTRVDTIFGCTYLVVAPEHEMIGNQKLEIKNYEEVRSYIEEAKKKSERDRQADVKDKTGVKLEGVVAINPANGKEIPIFVADYVLAGYGTGAIMAVPAHDSRDFEFAKKYKMPVIEVIKGEDKNSDIYEGEGILINSDNFNELKSEQAREKIGQWLVDEKVAEKKINFKLRDWVFSRQRYWGEPIPLIYCEKCGWVAVEEKDLPLELPDIKDYKPTDSGESPLSKAESWVNTKCPNCKGPSKRETDVMPNWAGSNWYFMRYCDPQNSEEFASKESLEYLMPVDWYNGGMEHTTLHLLYSRFVYKFLWDIGEVPKELGPEPYKKRTSHGMILAEGGVKMSKSKGNVINPDDVVKEYGADTLRLYEMFMGPFDQAIAWDTKSIKGSRKFLDRVYNFQFSIFNFQKNPKLEKLLNKTIKKVGEDIEQMKFNTAISALMILLNEMEKEQEVSKEFFEKFLLILSPFVPHIAEELYSGIRNQESGIKVEGKSIFEQEWPKHNDDLLKDEKAKVVVQVNGKARGVVEIEVGTVQEGVLEIIKEDEKINQWIKGKKIKKVVFIQDKILNIVI